MTTQMAIPVEVRPEEIYRERTLGGAVALCAKVAGFDIDNELKKKLGVDAAQFSRWQSGQEGIVWPKFEKLMDVCGNDAPLLWMLHQRGYDLTSLRKLETETQRENRELREQIAHLQHTLLSLGRVADRLAA